MFSPFHYLRNRTGHQPTPPSPKKAKASKRCILMRNTFQGAI
ncbi:unnamed protein product [Acidithrix sp. C25]|nr:unnamed protein product [Acidithrix sp. C25]